MTPIERLMRYENLPPPMVGDPPVDELASWAERERAVYEAMMREKRARLSE